VFYGCCASTKDVPRRIDAGNHVGQGAPQYQRPHRSA
jgi:hypothetical protein